MNKSFEHGYALIIGVDANQMPRLALPAVAKDVQAIYDVLIHPERCAYKPENVRLIKGEDSTSKAILDGLYWLQKKVREDGEATAVIYYSGHGMVDKATDQYYLIPYDIRELSRLRADAIKAETFTAEIGDIQARRMLVVLDCCHAAGMDVKNVDLAALEAGRVETAAFPLDLPETQSVPVFEAESGAKNISALLTEGEGRAILNSSNGAQSSYVRSDGAMSLFTYHLIEALTGHAPHPDNATVVYVTDVMSWVTHQVKKSAREQGRDQTPVMRTSGVFPVAQLIGGRGVAKGIGQLPPAPLAPLPQVGTTFDQQNQTVFNQQNQTVSGSQVNAGGNVQKSNVHVGNNINMGGGDFFELGKRSVIQRNQYKDINTGGGNFTVGENVTQTNVQGDQVADNRVGDQISIGGDLSGHGNAIGSGAQVRDVSVQQGVSADELAPLFAPLLRIVEQQEPTAVAQVQDLQAEVAKGEGADDAKMAGLIRSIAKAAPAAVETIVGLFTTSAIAKVAGGITQFALGTIRE